MIEFRSEYIENLTEKMARAMALERLSIKEHNVYLMDFDDGVYDYSMLVFHSGRQISYANDYQLHHRHLSKDELRQWYIKSANNKLFTDEEIIGPVSDYDEYRRKDNYLRNYYSQRREYISVFYIGTEEEQKNRNRKIGQRIFDSVCFGYYKRSDSDFVKKHVELFSALQKSLSKMEDNYDYWKGAFLQEMFNHEYSIDWQADYDTLSAFGNIEYEGKDATLDSYFNKLGFNDIKRRAYVDARKAYYEKVG